jgi:hypothetical protein
MEEPAYTVIHVCVQEVYRFSDGTVIMHVCSNILQPQTFRDVSARPHTERIIMDLYTEHHSCIAKALRDTGFETYRTSLGQT